MDKVLGIIAEYNPFHNGHLYHLTESKKITGANYSVAVISGNFTQRGVPSIINKWEKAKMALLSGVDLVIELPTLYAISSSENFAEGGIKILNSLGIVDFISFGAETADISCLSNIANILYDEPDKYKKLLYAELKSGLSFPKAREIALETYIKSNKNIMGNFDGYNIEQILSSPNNILGIEYLKALKKINSNIEPVCISRVANNYSSNEYSNNIASSTAIRNLLNLKKYDEIKNLLPNKSYSVLMENINNGTFIENINVFEKEIVYCFRKMSLQEIKNLPDVSEGLEFSIKNAFNSSNSLLEIMNMVKSKRYTFTRLQRIFLYGLLGITKDNMQISRDSTPFIRVLGFNENGKKLLNKINKNVQIVTSVKKFVDKNKNDNFSKLIEKDILSTNIYTLGFRNNSVSNLDFTNEIIKIK